MIFVASSSPVPIYNIYRAENGITNADLSLSVVAYFAGTILALVCLGRLVNHLGRKPVSLATLIVCRTSCRQTYSPTYCSLYPLSPCR